MFASVSTAASLTREQVQAILVEPLEQASVFLAAGPRIFDTDGSPVRVPKLTAMDAPAFIGENTQIDAVEGTFDEVTLLPSTMKIVKSLTRFSNELARQSIIALDTSPSGPCLFQRTRISPRSQVAFMNISPVPCFTPASRTLESERTDPLAPIALGTSTAVPRSATTPTTTPPTTTLDFMGNFQS